MLKQKIVLRYRKGSTNESQNCRYCREFIPNQLTDGSRGAGKYSMHWPGRCEIIGVFAMRATDGRKLTVRSDYTCDAQMSPYAGNITRRHAGGAL